MSEAVNQRISESAKRRGSESAGRRNIVRDWWLVILLVILVLATGLRFYRLDGQSFWNDEGNSVRLVERPWATMVGGAAADIHPPGYYALLWGWVRLFGFSEIAVRSLSALLGLLLVYVTYRLGRLLDGPAVGLAAALVAAVAPFQVYYSQEARMYILVALSGALSMYFFVCLLTDQSPNSQSTSSQSTSCPPGIRCAIPFYALSTALGLYSHYSFPVVIAAQNVFFIIWLATTVGRVANLSYIARLVARWALAQGLAMALYLPWLPVAWRRITGWPAISPAYSPGYIAGEAFRLLSLGPTVEPERAWPWLVGFGVLFLLGVRIGESASQRISESANQRGGELANREINRWAGWWGSVLLLLYCTAPVVLMIALSLLGRPAYRPKFFLVAAPAFAIIVGRGMVNGGRLLGSVVKWLEGWKVGRLEGLWYGAATLFILAAAFFPLRNYYFDPRYARDDYRGISRYIEATERPGDAVILNAPNQWEVFTYYYHGGADLYPMPRSRPPREEAVVAELEHIVAEHDRIFAILWGIEEADPTRIVERWLEAHTYKALDTWYGNVRLAVYAVPRAVPDTPAQPLSAHLGEHIALRGYTLLDDTLPAGDILQLTLFWQALEKPPARYKVFVQLLDAANHIVGQRDSEPGSGLSLTINWQPGQEVCDNHGVLIRPGTPPGKYRLIVGMYDLMTGQRLPITVDGDMEGDYLLLQTITVTRPAVPPPPLALGMQHQVGKSYGEVVLLGYTMHKLGYAHQPDAPLHPGDVLHLDVYWQARQRPQAEVRWMLRLADSKGEVWGEWSGPLAGVGYPPTVWQEGEVVRGQFDLFIPAEAPPGRYRLWGEIVAPGPVTLGEWASVWFEVKAKQ